MSTRREWLRLCGVGACGGLGTLSGGGCDALWGDLSRRLGADIPAHVGVPDGAAVDWTHHLLGRAGFGPWPGDRDRVRTMGAQAWIDEQLEPEAIDDWACEARTAWLEAVHVGPGLASELRPTTVEEQLGTYTVLQAVYSRRQLQQVMVAFWSDHFNIAIGKGHCRWLKPTDDRTVIRRHALGRFRDLLGASARSAAMLVYLDGTHNHVDGPGSVANENYARELLELHGLGVHAGYTQRDIMEAARCLTGWVVREQWSPGAVEFVPQRHDDGEKRVLGQVIPAGGGASDMDRLLDIVAEQPACARFIAAKLCRRLVAVDPPAAVVEAATGTFVRTGGEIKAVLRTILNSEAFWQSAGSLFKRPFRFVVSALRGLGADTHARPGLLQHLQRMGQALFHHPTPDGYPVEPQAWLGTLLGRWNFALDLTHARIEEAAVDLPRLGAALGPGELPLVHHLLGRSPSDHERAAFESVVAAAEPGAAQADLVAVVLSSPAYQRH